MQTHNLGNKLALFFLNPFISAIVSLKNIRDGVSHRILYLWFLVFGIGFCAMNEAADSFRYVEDFLVESQYTWAQYMQTVREWATFESNIKDIYTLTVNVLVGHFTSNYHWTYLIYAAVFGYFYIKSLRLFLKYQQVQSNVIFYFLLFLFCYSNPIFNINGVRFWTASWIAVYASLQIVLENKYHYSLLLVITPLVHGTFPIWISLLFISLISGRFNKIWKALFVASSFVTALSFLSILDDYSGYLPQYMQNQIWSYTQSEGALKKMSGELTADLPLYAQIFNALPGYFTLFLSYLIVFNSKKFTENPTSKHTYQIFIVLATLTNFLSAIPSVGRFKALVVPFIVILWAMNHDKLRNFDKYFYYIPLCYCYSLLYWYRNMSSVTELYLYIFPAPLTIIYYLFV